MIACFVALILLLDASGSVRDADWDTQVEATAAAFEDPGILQVIEREGGIAVSARSFSDISRAMVRWRHIQDAGAAARFAADLRAAGRGPAGGTDIGGALAEAMATFDEAPCTPDAEVIDLATDGEAPAAPVRDARDAAVARGVRINALAVGARASAEWLEQNAMTPGGFVMVASDWQAFRLAIRRKITLELADRPARRRDVRLGGCPWPDLPPTCTWLPPGGAWRISAAWRQEPPPPSAGSWRQQRSGSRPWTTSWRWLDVPPGAAIPLPIATWN